MVKVCNLRSYLKLLGIVGIWRDIVPFGTSSLLKNLKVKYFICFVLFDTQGEFLYVDLP